MAGKLGFFVYGTLRRGYGNYRWALADLDHEVVPATLAGARMFATGRSYPYVSTKGATSDDIVVGELVEVGPADYATALERLDSLEGHPVHYTRTETVVEAQGVPTRAWAYLAGPAVQARLSDADVVAGGDWAEVA